MNANSIGLQFSEELTYYYHFNPLKITRREVAEEDKTMSKKVLSHQIRTVPNEYSFEYATRFSSMWIPQLTANCRY